MVKVLIQPLYECKNKNVLKCTKVKVKIIFLQFIKQYINRVAVLTNVPLLHVHTIVIFTFLFFLELKMS